MSSAGLFLFIYAIQPADQPASFAVAHVETELQGCSLGVLSVRYLAVPTERCSTRRGSQRLEKPAYLLSGQGADISGRAW